MPSREEMLKIDLFHNGDFESNPNGDLKRVKGLENLNQRLMNRLITVSGTLIHRPYFGVGIQKWKGQISTLDKKRALALNIQEQFELDSGIESVNQVRFQEDDNRPDLFIIFVKYTAIGYNDLENVFDPFDIEG